MNDYCVAYDDFGIVRSCKISAVSAKSAELKFLNQYGYDVVSVEEVNR